MKTYAIAFRSTSMVTIGADYYLHQDKFFHFYQIKASNAMASFNDSDIEFIREQPIVEDDNSNQEYIDHVCYISAKAVKEGESGTPLASCEDHLEVMYGDISPYKQICCPYCEKVLVKHRGGGQ